MADNTNPPPCRGYRSRVTPWRPHVLCRGCARWQWEVPGELPELIDKPDGTVECPDRIPLRAP